jgi:hypothetical protein
VSHSRRSHAATSVRFWLTAASRRASSRVANLVAAPRAFGYALPCCSEVERVRAYTVFFVLALILAVATVVFAVLAARS